MNIIDLSLTIDNSCMTCGTPWHERVQIEKMGSLETVGRNTSRFLLGSHSATHMDAPLHFIKGTYGIDEIDPERCWGPVSCVDLRGKKRGTVVELRDIENVEITERMLFVFGWWKNWKTPRYYTRFPFFSIEAIRYLIESGMRFLALDTPSPDDGSGIQEMDDSPNHKILLENDVIIVEYLTNTDQIDFSKKYEIAALPLKIAGADGAPARVIIKEI